MYPICTARLTFRDISRMSGQYGTWNPITLSWVSGWRSAFRFRSTAWFVTPVAMSTPAPIAPWCRFARPPDACVGRRSIAITGSSR